MQHKCQVLPFPDAKTTVYYPKSVTHPESIWKERLWRKERLANQKASWDAPGFSKNYLISPENDKTLPWTLFTKDKEYKQ